MTSKKLEKLEKKKSQNDGYFLFTIGYEGLSFEDYLEELTERKIRAVFDVRKNAISRKRGFSKRALSESLEKSAIKYVHTPALGIDSKKRQAVKSDHAHLLRYYKAHLSNEGKRALKEIEKVFKEYKRIAITCFENDVNMCHRSRVAKAMADRLNWEYQVEHIQPEACKL